jgi:hypothetical protein
MLQFKEEEAAHRVQFYHVFESSFSNFQTLVTTQQEQFNNILPVLIQQTTYPLIEARKADQDQFNNLLQGSLKSINNLFENALSYLSTTREDENQKLESLLTKIVQNQEAEIKSKEVRESRQQEDKSTEVSSTEAWKSSVEGILVKLAELTEKVDQMQVSHKAAATNHSPKNLEYTTAKRRMTQRLITRNPGDRQDSKEKKT